MSRSILIRVVCLLSIFAGSGVFAQTSAAIEVDIPAQPVGDALNQFAEQSGLQVVLYADDAEGVETTAVAGKFDDSELVLDALLASTGLEYFFINDRTVSVSSLDDEQGGDSDSKNSQPMPILMAQKTTQTQTTVSSRSDDDAAEAREDESPVPLEEIVVTGTNIRGFAPKSSPTIVIDSQAISESGFSTIGEYLEFLPQNFTNIGDDFFNGGRGSDGPAINLRGLGANETLVLLNGRRVASSTSLGSFVDLSQIPATAIDRIEILLDGASAIYGSDAVAGVVNIILKDEVDGIQINARYGAVTDGGLDEYRLSATGGVDWSEGGLVLSYEYFDRSDLLASDRDFVNAEVDFDIIPDEQRHSLTTAINHQLFDSVQLKIDSLVSLEDSAPNQSNLFGAVSNDISRDLYWAGGALSGSLLGFNYDIEGSYSLRDEQLINTLLSTPSSSPRIFDFNTDTSVYTVDAVISRSIWSLPGGDVLAAFGGGYRGQRVQAETLDGAGAELFSIDADRTINQVFGEIALPIFGPANARPFLHELEASASIRRESFSDFGASTNPKIGLVWSPFEALSIRGSWGTSFRAPELRSINGQGSLLVYDLSSLGIGDPFPELGDNIAAAALGPNPGLGPQESESYSVGFDFQPAGLPGLSLSLNYFDFEYDDQVAQPVFIFGLAGALSNPNTISLYTLNPSNELLTSFADNAGAIRSFVPGIDLDDPSTYGPINLLFDGRERNLASSSARGLDIALNYEHEAPFGTLRFGFNSVYLLENEFTVIDGADSVDTLNIVGNPVNFQFRSSVGYSRGGFSSTVFVNHTASYDDDPAIADPPDRIDSWTTVDLTIRYTFEENAGPLHGAAAAISVQNLFDNDPPFVGSTVLPSFGVALGYDLANANPRGRFIVFEVSKQF